MKKLLLILALSASCAHAVYEKEDGTPIGHHELGRVGKIFAQHKQSKPLLELIMDLDPMGRKIINEKTNRIYAERYYPGRQHLLNDMATAAEQGNWKTFYALAKHDKEINSLLTPWYKKPSIWAGIAGTAAVILAGTFGWHRYHTRRPLTHTNIVTLLESPTLPGSIRKVLKEAQRRLGDDTAIAGWSQSSQTDSVLVRFVKPGGGYLSLSGTPDQIISGGWGIAPARLSQPSEDIEPL